MAGSTKWILSNMLGENQRRPKNELTSEYMVELWRHFILQKPLELSHADKETPAASTQEGLLGYKCFAEHYHFSANLINGEVVIPGCIWTSCMLPKVAANSREWLVACAQKRRCSHVDQHWVEIIAIKQPSFSTRYQPLPAPEHHAPHR